MPSPALNIQLEVFEYFYDESTGTYMLWTIYEIDPSINYVEALVFFDENGDLSIGIVLKSLGSVITHKGTTFSNTFG